MRLNKNNKGRMAGPASLLGLVGLLAIGLICPQFDATYAAEVVDCASVFSGVQTSSIIEDENGEAGLAMQTDEGVSAQDVQMCLQQTIGVSFTVVPTHIPSTPAGGVTNIDVDFIVKKASDPEETDEPIDVTFVVVGTHKDLERLATIEVQFNVEEFLELIATDSTMNNTDGTTSERPSLEDCVAGGKTEAECAEIVDGFDFGMTVDATSTGAPASDQVAFRVRGNNRNGFGVYVYAADGQSTALVHSDAEIHKMITTLEDDDVAYANLPVNTWGYNVTSRQNGMLSAINADTLSYSGLKHATGISPVVYSLTASDGIDFAITTATKVDTSMPSGVYSTSMIVSAVAPFTPSLIESGIATASYEDVALAQSFIASYQDDEDDAEDENENGGAEDDETPESN